MPIQAHAVLQAVHQRPRVAVFRPRMLDSMRMALAAGSRCTAAAVAAAGNVAGRSRELRPLRLPLLLLLLLLLRRRRGQHDRGCLVARRSRARRCISGS